jgi:chorismate synthase
VCAVSAASVVAEAMVALVVADAALARIGGETMDEFGARYRTHQDRVRELGAGPPPEGGSRPAAGGFRA